MSEVRIKLTFYVSSIEHSKEAQVELVDLFLLAAVFLITALGLYELFIDETVPVPAWLEVRSLDDLKAKLISVVVTILGVLFLGRATARHEVQHQEQVAASWLLQGPR